MDAMVVNPGQPDSIYETEISKPSLPGAKRLSPLPVRLMIDVRQTSTCPSALVTRKENDHESRRRHSRTS